MTQRGSTIEIFGQHDDGDNPVRSIHRVTLRGGGLTANIITWGAVLQDLRLEGHAAPLVLGFNEFENYPAHSPYFGATAGRFANRIANGQFSIDGTTYNTNRNFLDKHTLHGGSRGIGKRIWKIADLGTSHVDLVLKDPDGAMGFPGTCTITCSYSLKDDGNLHIAYSTRSDAPTIASLAHHSYFILDDTGDCRAHSLQIAADAYLPVNDELIPTGDIADVTGTPFDFRNSKFIGHDLPEKPGSGLIYDHNFCLAKKRRNLQDVAEVHSGASNITMTVATTEPGLQFYAGHKLNTPVPGLAGIPYGAHAGLCLETQNWPDAPNHKNFPDAVLHPDEVMRQVTEYRFSKG